MLQDAVRTVVDVIAKFERNLLRNRRQIGIDRARKESPRSYLGRKPSYTREQLAKVLDMLRLETLGMTDIAKETGSTESSKTPRPLRWLWLHGKETDGAPTGGQHDHRHRKHAARA